MIGAGGVGVIAQLVASLLEGGTLDAVISKKLEDLGEDFLMKQLAGPFAGLGQRITAGVSSGGMSEIDRIGTEWLSKVKPGPFPHQDVLNKLLQMLNSTSQSRSGNQQQADGFRRRSRWARSQWATGRDDWLDNHWKHDWRSQPRNEQGRWVPGRLDYVEATLHYQGVHPGRRTLRRRRLRARSRRKGRKAARQLFRQMVKNAR
jgi:hypothetical protein